MALLGVSALAAAEATAQPPEDPTPVRAFRNFVKRTSPGLPQSTASALLQDDQGRLWIATLDGLASYDGTEIRPVEEHPEAPVFGALRSLAHRHEGGFHVGGANAVFTFDGHTWRRRAAAGATVSLAEDDEGQLWRISDGGELSVLGSHGGWQGESDSAVALASGPDGALWLAERHRVRVRRQGTWHPVAGGAETDEAITALLPTADGGCWVGTAGGELRFAGPDANGWTSYTLPAWQGGWIRALAEDRRGRLWVGGSRGGAAFGTPGDWQLWGPEHGLFREGVIDILADREGTIWFSINGHGLQQWVGESWSHRNLWRGDEGLERRLPVFGITGTADGGFLVAVFNRGIWQWDGRSMRQLGRDRGLLEDLRSATEPQPGLLWVGARFGIYEARGEETFQRTLELDSGFVYGFYRAPDGGWLASTSSSGLFRRDPGSLATPSRWQPAAELNVHLPDLNVRSVLWRSNGELWVGTMGGIGRFAADGSPGPAAPEGLPDAVHALLEVDGEVWAAGFGGIGRWDGNEVRSWNAADGLPGNTIYSLVRSPDGAVWAGGSTGVGRYADGGWQQWGLGSGLLEAECNHLGLWAAPDGAVYVGTMASLARFDPGVVPLPEPPLRLFWNHLPPANDRGVHRLPPERRSLRLSWTAPWLAPRPIEFRTRIPRLSRQWSPPSGNATLALENLHPGPLAVEVEGRFVGRREWTPTLRTELYVAPRWWESWSAKLAAILGLVVLVLAVIRWRTRRLARRARQLEEAVQASIAQIKVLGGLLPICSHCKKVRDDAGYWQQIESYIREHSEADFSHGLCPECCTELYPEFQGSPPSEGNPPGE